MVLNLFILLQVTMSKLFNHKIKNILKKKMISSLTQTTKTHSGLVISLQECQLKDSLEILVDGFKLSESKYLKLK
jgi:ribose 5-phosphate isomerase